MARLGSVLLFSLILMHTLFSVSAQSTTGSAQWSLPPVRVLNASGAPIAGAEVAMTKPKSPMVCFRTLTSGQNGEVTFTQEQYSWPGPTQVPPGEYEVMVFVRGSAPVFSRWQQPTSSPLVIKTDSDPVPIEVQLSGPGGKPVPSDVIPMFYPAEYSFSMWPTKNVGKKLEPRWPEPLGDGKFRIYLEEGTTAPLQMLVHHPDYLRSFSKTIETTEALQQKVVKVQLPAPGTAVMRLEIPEKFTNSARNKKFSFTVSTLVSLGVDQMYLPCAETVTVKGDAVLSTTVANLTPEGYWMSVGESIETSGSERSKMALFDSGEGVDISSDQTTTVLFQYNEFDPSKLRGNHTANISVKKLDGTPAAGLEFELRNIDQDFGWNVVTTGVLSESGTTTIEGLAGGTEKAPLFRLYEGGEWGHLIGRIRMDKPGTSSSFEFTLAPKPGDVAPNVTFTDVYTSQPVKLADFTGKVIVLDFWATWCGPCQAPMAHNQKMLSDHPEWKDKVVIIGASIDDDTETVRKHVKDKGWDKVRHLWCGADARDSAATRTYGVDGVPTIFLISANGKIVKQTGDLEEQIETLLKQDNH